MIENTEVVLRCQIEDKESGTIVPYLPKKATANPLLFAWLR